MLSKPLENQRAAQHPRHRNARAEKSEAEERETSAFILMRKMG